MSLARLMPLDPRAETWRDIDPADETRERWIKISLYVLAILFLVAAPFLRHYLLGDIQPNPDFCSGICLSSSLYMMRLTPTFCCITIAGFIDLQKNARLHEKLLYTQRDRRCRDNLQILTTCSLSRFIDARERGVFNLSLYVQDGVLTPDEGDTVRNLIEQFRCLRSDKTALEKLESKWKELKKELFILEGKN